MTRITPSLPVTALLMLGLAAAPARASCNPPFCTPTFSHTYVSAATGSDGNNCGFGAPCRTFQRAHDQTNDQGVITVLDPGDFGPLTIAKSISIVNDGGGEASILVKGSAAGITVNGGAGAYVNLRGITVQGVGGTGAGVTFANGFSLTMENCVVRNLSNNGISLVPNGGGHVAMSNTLVADNGGAAIVFGANSGSIKAVLNRVEMYHNSNGGIIVDGNTGTGTIDVTVADSVAANNSANGFGVTAVVGQAATARLMVVRSVAANNAVTGISADGAKATLRIGQSVMTGNANSWLSTNGATLQSYADNKIDGNGDASPTPFLIVKK